MDIDKFKGDVTFFFKTLIEEIQSDRVTSGAAALGFYLTLAILPALISCIALFAYLPVEGAREFVFTNIQNYLPGDIGSTLIKVLKEATKERSPGILSTGFIGALWATSSGMSATINQLNVVYDVENNRSLILDRLISVGTTILYLVLVIIGSTLIVFAQNSEYSLLKILTDNSKLGFFEDLLSYIASYVVLLFSFGLMYYIAPNTKLKFRFITPGSFAGSTILIIAALGFDYYLSNFASYDQLYGGIAGFIILMLWLYISGFVLLLGAEINSVYRNIRLDEKKENS